MRNFKMFCGLAAIAAGLSGASVLSAADWNRRDVYNDRQDMRYDYATINRLQADIAGDRARMNEDIRCGRSQAAARDAADLARDQRRLDGMRRDVRSDRRDLRQDYGYRQSYGYRNSWR